MRIQHYAVAHDLESHMTLSRRDWEILENIHSTLHTYYEATLCGEGRDHHLSRWFPILDFIFSETSEALGSYKDMKSRNPHCEEYVWLEAAASGAWDKCKQYYNLADDSAAYYAAEVLQPDRKWGWQICQQWGDDPQKRSWLEKTQKAVREFWEEYKGKFSTPATATSQPSRPRHPDDEFGALSEHFKIRTARPIVNDAYTAYIDRDIDNPLEYWNSRILSQPDLARFALDMLAIPVSSAECERVFSSASC
jgi:hAT family C-terminal dimerisation region